MVRHSNLPALSSPDVLPPLPISVDLWHKIAASMQLTGQHRCVVEYVLRGMSDKQIELAMGICHSTLRTYFDRIAFRNGPRGRSAILRHVLGLSHQLTASCPPEC